MDLNCCRFCLTHADDLHNLLDDHPTDLPRQIFEALALTVTQGDNLPDKICKYCTSTIKYISDYKRIVIKAQETFQKHKRISSIPLDGGLEPPVLDIFEQLKRRAMLSIEHYIFIAEPLVEIKVEDASPDLVGASSASEELNTPKRRERQAKTRNYICDVCGKCYHSPAHLKVHANVHSGHKAYKCPRPDCGATFMHEWALRNHHKTHLTTRDFCCDLCGKTYKRKFQIEVHMTYHTEPKLPCPFCGKLLRHRDVLNRHVAQVHENRRNHECTECDKRFGNAHNLKIHMRAHRNEKIFECARCSIKFAYKSSLKAHNQKVHGIVLF